MALTNLQANITLDVYDHDGTKPSIKAIALDNDTRYVLANITYRGERYDIGSSPSVQLIVIRPDNVGVQVIGQPQEIVIGVEDDTPVTVYGAYAELDQAALAISGTLLGQFKITSGDQILKTQVFKILNGQALDAEEWAGDYDGYNLDELVADVAEAVEKVGDLETDVAQIKEDLHDISTTVDTTDSDADLYITDTRGNVLAEFSEGDFKTQNFNSAEVSGDVASTEEIDLSQYPVVNFNFEYGNTWTSGGYRGVMIPFEDLGDYVRFVATQNKIVCCFLTDNAITANQLPHCCVGTAPIRMGQGADETLEVPKDCAYLYVYVSQNSQLIGQIHLYALVSATKVKSMIADLQKQIDEMQSKTGLCYVSGAEQVIRTLKHWHTNSYNDFRAYTSGDNLVTVAHISDIHNDPNSYGRFISLLNEFNGVIDCGLATGDIVDGPGTECFAEMVAEEDALETGTKLLKVVGNHDRISAPLDELYTWMNMSISTESNSLYYVHDFAEQKIRIIVLNQYDTTSGQLGKTGHYSQDQLDWFVARLQEAITNNYHVVVAYHSCSEVGLPERNEKGFCQNTYMGFDESVSGEHIVEDIIDAFQNGTSISKSVTYPDSNVTVTVNATFSAKGTFVCYFCGHGHFDYIGYSRVYPNQLICMVQGAVIDSTKRNEATAHWQGMYDTPRISGTSTADSINVYAIDPLARLVKVVKIGSTLTDKFIPRSFATFGY